MARSGQLNLALVASASEEDSDDLVNKAEEQLLVVENLEAQVTTAKRRLMSLQLKMRSKKNKKGKRDKVKSPRDSPSGMTHSGSSSKMPQALVDAGNSASASAGNVNVVTAVSSGTVFLAPHHVPAQGLKDQYDALNAEAERGRKDRRREEEKQSTLRSEGGKRSLDAENRRGDAYMRDRDAGRSGYAERQAERERKQREGDDRHEGKEGEGCVQFT